MRSSATTIRRGRERILARAHHGRTRVILAPTTHAAVVDADDAETILTGTPARSRRGPSMCTQVRAHLPGSRRAPADRRLVERTQRSGDRDAVLVFALRGVRRSLPNAAADPNRPMPKRAPFVRPRHDSHRLREAR
jgi:hypothetical protein